MVTLAIQKDRILGNLKKIQERLGDAAIIPEVECDGYGMGCVALSSLYFAAGARMVSTGSLRQAERIRAQLPSLSVLLTTPYTSLAHMRRIAAAGIIPSAGCGEDLRLLGEVAAERGERMTCHIRLDVGSGLAGFPAGEPEPFIESLVGQTQVKIGGVFSVFSDPEAAVDTKREYKSFLSVCEAMQEEGFSVGLAHISDDRSAFRSPEYALDAVRIGPAIGGRLAGKDKWNLELQKVGWLVAEVCSVRTVDDRTVALVPLGLADGIFAGDGLEPELLGSKDIGCSMFGERLPVYGVPTLGLCAVDVTGFECEVGDIAAFDVNPVMIKAEVKREYT